MSSSADEILFYAFFVLGTLGFLVNIFLLTLIFSKKELRESEYMIFIINRASIDLIFSLHAIILQPLGIKYWRSDPIFCTIAGGIANSLAMIMIISEPMLACNRYVSVCHNLTYPKIYQKRNIYFLCILTWIFGSFVSIAHIIENSLGRVPGCFCCVKAERDYLFVIILSDYPVFFFSYGFVFYCYSKIFLVLRHHQEHTQNSGLTSRLQEQKSFLTYIGVAAILPLLTETPVTVAIGIRMYNALFVSDFAMFAGSFIFFLCPIINPMLTLFVIRPLKKEFFHVMKGLFEKNLVKPINIRS